jgi:hypothetical protein
MLPTYERSSHPEKVATGWVSQDDAAKKRAHQQGTEGGPHSEEQRGFQQREISVSALAFPKH